MVVNFENLSAEDTHATTKTMYGQAMGSPYFMPPEQAEGRVNDIDERSDVYSLGAVLYTLISGQLPFVGMNVREFLKKVSTEMPRPIREIDPNASPELVAICERAMNKDPQRRYQSAKELAEDIRRYITGGLVGAYEYKLSEHIKRYVKKHKNAIMVLAASLAILVGVGVYSYVRIVQEKAIAIEQRDRAEEATQEALLARNRKRSRKSRPNRNWGFCQYCVDGACNRRGADGAGPTPVGDMSCSVSWMGMGSARVLVQWRYDDPGFGGPDVAVAPVGCTGCGGLE